MTLNFLVVTREAGETGISYNQVKLPHFSIHEWYSIIWASEAERALIVNCNNVFTNWYMLIILMLLSLPRPTSNDISEVMSSCSIHAETRCARRKNTLVSQLLITIFSPSLLCSLYWKCCIFMLSAIHDILKVHTWLHYQDHQIHTVIFLQDSLPINWERQCQHELSIRVWGTWGLWPCMNEIVDLFAKSLGILSSWPVVT